MGNPIPTLLQLRTRAPAYAKRQDQAPTRLPENLIHKNRLQEYTQRSCIPFPKYQTVNEGFKHAPKFRSTMVVDGLSYTSLNTFSHRKAAEQDVAKLAFECISKRVKVLEAYWLGIQALGSKIVLPFYCDKLFTSIFFSNFLWCFLNLSPKI